jgi:hypothetical protein
MIGSWDTWDLIVGVYSYKEGALSTFIFTPAVDRSCLRPPVFSLFGESSGRVAVLTPPQPSHLFSVFLVSWYGSKEGPGTAPFPPKKIAASGQCNMRASVTLGAERAGVMSSFNKYTARGFCEPSAVVQTWSE